MTNMHYASLILHKAAAGRSIVAAWDTSRISLRASTECMSKIGHESHESIIEPKLQPTSMAFDPATVYIPSHFLRTSTVLCST